MDIIGVTNRKLCNDFYKRIKEISKSNLKYLILREKDLEYKELLIMAKNVQSILKDSNIKLIINSNVEVAEEVNAYGIQLSFKDFCENKGKNFNGIKGVSVHSLSEAIEAEKRGANYIIYGHVFNTDCKKGLKPRGLIEFKEICNKVNIPVYAIGGINKENYKSVLEIGADGVAVMSSLMKNSILSIKIKTY
ncbi:MAG: thiamine phosphate synthase [Clostridium sp.]|nr:thiamine phosphate synthase [Clostridium sp.]